MSTLAIQNEYIKGLIEFGKLPARPSVLQKIYDDAGVTRMEHPNHYRDYNYTIVDDDTFTSECIEIGKASPMSPSS